MFLYNFGIMWKKYKFVLSSVVYKSNFWVLWRTHSGPCSNALQRIVCKCMWLNFYGKDVQHVDGTNRRIQSALFLNRKCIFKTLSTWLMDVNNLDFTPFTMEKPKIHWICCRCFVGQYELQHYRSSAVQLGAFLWACPLKIMLQ